MPRNRLFFPLIGFFLCAFSVHVYSDVLTLGSAINKSGRQRMLTQNILKNYLALGLEVDVARAREELDRSVALFEEQYLELIDYAPTEQIATSLSEVENLWFEYRVMAISRFSRENAAKMLDRNNTILAACHKVVVELEQFAGRKSAVMVNISGRQRMLSQRIAAYYFAHAMGFRDSAILLEFEQAKAEYAQGLQTLIAYENNTLNIESGLKKVDAQWQFSNTGFEQLQEGYYVPHVISVTTSGMLKRMNAITQLYEELDESLAAAAIASVESED